MSIRFQPSKFGATGGFPDTQGYVVDGSLTVLRGAVMRYIPANDDVDEHPGTTTVVDILGVAGCDVASGVSDDPAGTLPVFKAKDIEFAGSVINAGTILTDLSTISIGDQFGVLKHSDNEWYVDEADVTNVTVQITKIDDDLNLVWFRFLESAIQEV